MSKKENTYSMNMHCENCGKNFRGIFKKGTYCKGYYPCDYCGCKEAKAEEAKVIFTGFDKLK